MAIAYTNARHTLDKIASRYNWSSERLDRARDAIVQAENELTAMQSDYTQFVNDIDTAAAENPNDAAWQAAKAQKDLMVSDFQALKTRATNLKNAFDAV